jgi:histidine triad (HIT) family protein
MASVFTKIIKGELPSHKIAENEHFYAFLDIAPIVPGHMLVIPKQEVDYLFDLDNQTLADLHLYCKPLAQALQAATGCVRVSTIVAGFEVPHAHIHLIPSNTMDDLSFERKQPASAEALAAMAERVRQYLPDNMR